jgi:hypothetical protein
MFLRLLIVFVALSISIQNTCPQGWAAKTAFVNCCAAKQSAHCPMHEQKQPRQDRRNDSKQGISNVKQAFVIHIVRLDNTYQIVDYESETHPIDSLTLTEIFSQPLFRPPISSTLA